MGKEARTGVAALCCTVGMIGSQTWMPAVGLFADMYRAGSFSVGNGAPLFLSYLVALALVASLFAVLRLKSAPGKGTYAALVGALLSCIGTVCFCCSTRWILRGWDSCFPSRAFCSDLATV